MTKRNRAGSYYVELERDMWISTWWDEVPEALGVTPRKEQAQQFASQRQAYPARDYARGFMEFPQAKARRVKSGKNKQEVRQVEQGITNVSKKVARW
jgi:hypothetical protein